MLLTPDQHAQLTAPPVSRRQAHIPFPMTRQWFWDSGVIPYEIAPNFSPAERQRVFDAMTTWTRTAPITFVPRTSQTGFLAITRDELTGPEASPCFSRAWATGWGRCRRFNLGQPVVQATWERSCTKWDMCSAISMSNSVSDRDDYVTIDFGNVPGNARHNFDRWTIQSPGPYDFGSVMHYAANAFALTGRDRQSFRSRSTIRDRTNGSRQLSDTDHNMMAVALLLADERERHPYADRAAARRDSIAATCCWRWSGCTAST